MVNIVLILYKLLWNNLKLLNGLMYYKAIIFVLLLYHSQCKWIYLNWFFFLSNSGMDNELQNLLSKIYIYHLYILLTFFIRDAFYLVLYLNIVFKWFLLFIIILIECFPVFRNIGFSKTFYNFISKLLYYHHCFTILNKIKFIKLI